MDFQVVGLGKRRRRHFPSRDFCIRSLFLVSEAREAHRILELHWVRDGLVRDFCIRSLFLVSEAREAHRILELHWVRDGLVRAWKGQPDPELWRSRCDPALRKDWEGKWEGIDAEIEMLAALEQRVLTYGLVLESRGALGGAVDFAAIRQEIEELPDRPGTTRELIEMIERGIGG
ncbi:hypothetical protein C367_04612 [Cryptococcus neoformans Ze90-1]|nr:hypothetical protein C367_04612 [Cryptococcus neoformans var. grubii Ze90-1]